MSISDIVYRPVGQTDGRRGGWTGGRTHASTCFFCTTRTASIHTGSINLDHATRFVRPFGAWCACVCVCSDACDSMQILNTCVHACIYTKAMRMGADTSMHLLLCLFLILDHLLHPPHGRDTYTHDHTRAHTHYIAIGHLERHMKGLRPMYARRVHGVCGHASARA